MPVWIQDKETGEWAQWRWMCLDNGADPAKEGHAIFNVWLDEARTRQKMMSEDKNGQKHDIDFVKIDDGFQIIPGKTPGASTGG